MCWHLVYGGKGQLGCKKGKEQMYEFSLLGANLGVRTKIALSHDVTGGTLILSGSSHLLSYLRNWE